MNKLREVHSRAEDVRENRRVVREHEVFVEDEWTRESADRIRLIWEVLARLNTHKCGEVEGQHF